MKSRKRDSHVEESSSGSDASESDAADVGDSAVLLRTRTGQQEEGDDDQLSPSDEEEELDNNIPRAASTRKTQDDPHDNNESANESDPEELQEHATANKAKKKVHKLSLKKTQDFNAQLRRRGVLYVARIPPRMTPTKVKTLLSDFGTVTRVFLQEEDAARRKRRRKLNGNSGGKRYTEGWVEFERRRSAKMAAAALHLQPVSNHKRNPHHGDLWNVKYLRKFQWSHLTEKVAYERRVREQKLRLETATARRETAHYKQLLETGAKLDKIAERRNKRKGAESSSLTTTTEFDKDDDKKRKKRGAFQVQPTDEGADKASRKSLLGSLV